MKKIVLFMLIVMTGCYTEPKKTLAPSHDSKLSIKYGMSTKLADRKIMLSKGLYMCESYHQITFDEACDLVSALLNQDNLYEQDTTYGAGGYMDSTAFEPGAIGGQVIQFFPCFDNNPAAVFLCYKDLKAYVDTNPNQCDLSDNEVLERSTNEFIYDMDKGHISPADVAEFISTMITDIAKTHSELAGKDVKIYNGQFFAQYNVNGIDQNNVHCGAMEKCEVMQLFNQTDASGKTYQCEGIRYFWGFDASRQNKIRLVLIGVRPDGSNLVHYDGGEDALMLEKEWPPDVVIGGDSLSVPHH